MAKRFRTFFLASFFALLLAVGLNMVKVPGGGPVGFDGYMQLYGFPFEACDKFVDLTNSNNKPDCAYRPVLANAFVAFFAVYGIWGNVYFFRELCKRTV